MLAVSPFSNSNGGSFTAGGNGSTATKLSRALRRELRKKLPQGSGQPSGRPKALPSSCTCTRGCQKPHCMGAGATVQQLALRHAVQHSLAGTFGVGDIVNVLPNDDVGIVRGEVMKLRESFNVYKVEYPPVVERADASKYKILPHISGKRMELVGDRPRTMTTALKQELAVRSGMFTGGVSEGSYRDNRQQHGIENQLKKKRDEANTGEEREDGASEGTVLKKAKKAKTKKESAAAPAVPVFVPQNAWW